MSDPRITTSAIPAKAVNHAEPSPATDFFNGLLDGSLTMPRTHEEIMASLPDARRAGIEVCAAEMLAEVEGLKAPRQTAECSQEQIAQGLGDLSA